MVDQPFEKGLHADEFQAFVLVECLVDNRQGIDPVPGSGDRLAGFRVLKLTPLKVQEARDDLEIVLHPVMDFFHGVIANFDRRFQVTVALIDICGHVFHRVGKFRYFRRRRRHGVCCPKGITASAVDTRDADKA